jgi:hypothetical protein
MQRIIFSALLAGLLFAGLVQSGENKDSKEQALELTQVARKFPRHKGATVLYVNFDGWRNYDGKSHDIQAFVGNSGTRERDIQDILFRTAQRFTPFDVEVRRITGNGRHDQGNAGNTTIFVGADTAHLDKNGKKYTYSSTPARYVDYPGKEKGTSHRPNSDPFDIGFVDPMEGKKDPASWKNVLGNDGVSQNIAHEAGHTFGLAHTHSKPVPDIMSYDAANRYFANKSLPITNDNNTGTKLEHDDSMLPKWHEEKVTRQNSFTYLQAVLGSRPAGAHARVADRAAVDPGFKDGTLTVVEPGASVKSSLGRLGEYDVYRLQMKEEKLLRIAVLPEEKSELAPVILIYDDKGERLLHYRAGRIANANEVRITVRLEGGNSYKLVVGAFDGGTKGDYQLTVEEVDTTAATRRSKPIREQPKSI